MKRTGEIALSVIGAVLNGLAALLAVFVVMIFQNQLFQDQFITEMNKESSLEGVDIKGALDLIEKLGWGIVILLFICMILAIIAAVKLKGNKAPKLAGILLIVAAILLAIFSGGLGWLPALLYLIAGIMSLARNPRKFVS